MSRINVIVAGAELPTTNAYHSTKLGIGYNGSIPWDIPEDIEHFKQLTIGGIVIMGRKT
jgi:dihydrofolate reductase